MIWIVLAVVVSIPSIETIENDAGAIVLNNMGDLLAGMFAPIAAGWLVLAVFLQQKELEATRLELKRQAKAQEEQLNTQTLNHIIQAIQLIDVEEKTEIIELKHDEMWQVILNIYEKNGFDHMQYGNPFDVQSYIDGFEDIVRACSHEDIECFLDVFREIEEVFEREFYIIETIVRHMLYDHPLLLAYITDSKWMKLVNMFNTMKGIRKLIRYGEGAPKNLREFREVLREQNDDFSE